MTSLSLPMTKRRRIAARSGLLSLLFSLPWAAAAQPIDPALFYGSLEAERWSAAVFAEVLEYSNYGLCPQHRERPEWKVGDLDPASRLPEALLSIRESVPLGSYQVFVHSSPGALDLSTTASTALASCWGTTEINPTSIGHYRDILFLQFENPENVPGLSPATAEMPGPLVFDFDYDTSHTYLLQGLPFAHSPTVLHLTSRQSNEPGFEIPHSLQASGSFYAAMDPAGNISYHPEPSVEMVADKALLQVSLSGHIGLKVDDRHPDLELPPGHTGIVPARRFATMQASVRLASLPPGYVCYSASGLFPGCDDELKPPENLVVLTHGWQPGKEIAALQAPHLLEVREALETRLIEENLRHRTKILDFRWPEAFTEAVLSYESLFAGTALEAPRASLAELMLWGGILLPFDIYATLGDYDFSFERTFDAGNRLALEILTFIEEQRELHDDPSYDPRIHFIGHSLGTMVNARAVERLRKEGLRDPSAKVSVEQVTILDDPLSVDASFFYDAMPRGSVAAVENFYASELVAAAPRFGAAIPGSFPCVPACEGEEVHGADHNQVHADFYAERILSPHWVSPVFPAWSPPILWDPARARSERGAAVGWRGGRGEARHLAPLSGTVDEPSPGTFVLRAGPDPDATPEAGSGAGSPARRAATGPARLGVERELPPTVRSVRFRAEAAGPGGWELELSFGGRVIWWTDSEAGLPVGGEPVLVPFPFASEQAELLVWELRSVGAGEAEVTISEVEYGTLFQATLQDGFESGDLSRWSLVSP